MADNEKVEDSVQVGQVYKAKEGGGEVTPYFLDNASAMVNYTPVGRSSEEKMFAPAFLKAYELVGPLSSQAEKPRDPKDNPAPEEPGMVVIKRNA